MENTIASEGKCLCGGVKVKAKTLSPHIGVCHCFMCRNWTGGPLFAADCGQAVEFEETDNISTYSSSEWAERGFCNKCGSHLFYRLKGNNQYMMPVGLFPDTIHWKFDHQIFIDEKPNYYCFANNTKEMTGAEVFAEYSND